MRLTMPTHSAHPLLALVLTLALPLAIACAPGGEDGEPAGKGAAGEAPAGERVESGGLGIALAALPAGFEVETNEGEELVLVNTEDGGTVSFVMTPLQSAGVNLQARVWEEKERIEGLPNGEYRGQNELGGVPLGTTYTSRGRFENEAGEAVEEYRALLVHPTQNRTLILDYEYPVPEPGAEGNPRLEDLMRVLEQVEPLAVTDAEAPAPEDAPMGAEPMEETPGDVEDAAEGDGNDT